MATPPFEILRVPCRWGEAVACFTEETEARQGHWEIRFPWGTEVFRGSAVWWDTLGELYAHMCMRIAEQRGAGAPRDPGASSGLEAG
jgi:hypothetical protein